VSCGQMSRHSRRGTGRAAGTESDNKPSQPLPKARLDATPPATLPCARRPVSGPAQRGAGPPQRLSAPTGNPVPFRGCPAAVSRNESRHPSTGPRGPGSGGRYNPPDSDPGAGVCLQARRPAGDTPHSVRQAAWALAGGRAVGGTGAALAPGLSPPRFLLLPRTACRWRVAAGPVGRRRRPRRRRAGACGAALAAAGTSLPPTARRLHLEGAAADRAGSGLPAVPAAGPEPGVRPHRSPSTRQG